MYELQGRVALVTGAARGIGRAIATRLADEGASVVSVDLEESSTLPNSSLSLRADVTSAAQVEAMAQAALDRFGRVDILVNNAGINIIAPMLEMSEPQWDKIFDVNLKSYWLCAKALVPQMIARGEGGKVINAASRAGKTPSKLAPIGAYATTKHAVVGFTRALAFELAPHRINVNCYCPGVVDTPMWDLIDREVATRTGQPLGSIKARAVADIPLGRIEQPDDVANLVAFLASRESDYMTGQAINITGGSEIH